MRYTIGQLAEIIDGDRGKNYPKQDEFYPQGYCLFLNTGNVTKEGLIFEENQFIMKEKDEALRKGKLKRGDIVYTTRGTVGNAGYYNSSVPYENIRINSGMVILRSNGEIVDARFLYQILKSEYYRPYFKQYCTGSAQPQLPIKNFSQIYLNVPDIKTQHRIADILSVYDNLIENNQKQIKLLEEAAQRLYKEWFVDLRFPGYENTKIVDGVPEGWSKSTVGNICKLRKVVITPDKIESDTPYIGLEHMPRNDICLSTWGKSEEINSNKFIYLKKDVLFGKIRPYFHKVGFALNDGITSTDTMVMVADQNLWGLLLVTVSSDAFVDFSYQNCKEGAKMPRADWKQMEKYTIMIADQATQKLFEQEILVITNKISALAFQCRSLREARDRMLPKLMGGEVEA